MSSLPEIVIILVIVVIVFGVGRVGKIGSHLSRAKNEFKKGMAGPDPASALKGEGVIDITPPDGEPEPSINPKPGTRRDPVEDADVESNA